VTPAWFVRPQPQPDARCRLFCFPYAGVGPAIYRTWSALLPADIDLWAVQPPGREARFREQPLADIDGLVESVCASMRPHLDRPFALFGHSMGACVAFEVARTLAARGAAPARLFVSGRRAPGAPNDEPDMHTLPDDAFVAEIRRRYNGIPDAVLEHPELLQLLLPALRADIAALERHTHRPAPLLACPVLALGGTHDTVVPVDELARWRAETSGEFALHVFEGGHFYLQDARDTLLRTIVATLRADLSRQTAASIVA
jgi:medium-chain acyl-[acyl-carrier-protein] hydrolase